ncbi:DUF397 domain-containing protein [Streptomyces sp. ICBB 8177]|uniref:DUF397 domain-containing protein n=1 Tax=Streptomyces sp. ICBB 8177 TaxID=563922 RepID=UPI000D6839B1|nr:DUF397 domain-containing protein [Streptomyces sp. ICBB 8177]PWI43390.1 DUF397 domain-containing protein [Streptomyces sp. ICBB 8177]
MENSTKLIGASWRKSSYSGDHGGDCVEVAALGTVQWRKSTYSADHGGDCVEVAELPDLIAVRDSKNPTGPALAFSPEAFRAFVGAVVGGELGA